MPVGVTDRFQSEGSIADVRGALALRLTNWLNLGGAVHIITGSTQLTTRRDFTDSTYRRVGEVNQLQFQGLGFSAGVTAIVHPRLGFSVAVRTDGELDVQRDSVPVGSIDLPRSVTGGLLVLPLPAVRWSTTVTYRTWSDATTGVAGEAVNAFDTWELGSGLELARSATAVPLRLGVRYAQLPFSPTLDRPTEIAVALGSAVTFATNRGTIDFGLERVFRDGGGAEERAWHLSFGLTIVP
jgi:hypothetical protein